MTIYEDSLLRLSTLIEDKVNSIARRTKVPHKVIWSDLDVLLMRIDDYRELPQ